ncbi:FadR/GntR family transcriptional regulator [Verticiella sediminum]
MVGPRPADEIIAQVREHLQQGRLKVGSRLPSERELSSQFQVSRNSVRQALRSLANMGLLDIRLGANGGPVVRGGGAEAVLSGLSDLYALGTIRPEHLTQVRVLLGVEVVRLACSAFDDSELAVLRNNVQEASQAADAGDLARRTSLNLDFYRILARMTRNPILELLTDAVLVLTERFVEQTGRTSNRSVMPMRRKMLQLLEQRDADAAADVMRQHLMQLQRIYLKAAPAGNAGQASAAQASAPSRPRSAKTPAAARNAAAVD